MNPLKRIILWDYSRGTWQYDVLCLLIIAFIFLTPKTWFDRREKLATQTASATVKSEDFLPEEAKNELDQHARLTPELSSPTSQQARLEANHTMQESR